MRDNPLPDTQDFCETKSMLPYSGSGSRGWNYGKTDQRGVNAEPNLTSTPKT